MDDNRFFKFIWRINALALATVLAFGVGLMIWEIALRDIMRERTAVEVVNIDITDSTLVETRTISVVSRVEGHNVFRVNLSSQQVYDSGYSSKNTVNTTLNIGFYDPAEGVTNWLFSDQNQLITSVKSVSSNSDGQHSQVTLAHFITFVDEDTSNDTRLSNSDKKSVMVVGPTGLNQEILLSGLEADPTIWELDSGKFVIFFINSDGRNSVIYNAITMTVGPIQKISLD